MSSFDATHHLYLFALTNGKRRLAYGRSPDDALEVLACRSSAEEMAQIVRDRYVVIAQWELRRHLADLG